MKVLEKIPISDAEKIIDRLKPYVDSMFQIIEYPLSSSEFDLYLKKASYPETYKKGFGRFFHEKALEHFVSLKVLTLDKQAVAMDVASSSSPFPDIVRNFYGCVCYRQDLIYPKGVHQYRVGGDACSLPFPDNSFTHLTLHCSFEHFEGDADGRFIQEASRVLVPGGILCILPLYLHETYFIMTDPSHLEYCRGVVDTDADIVLSEGWGNRFGRLYSPEAFMKRVLKYTDRFRVILYHLKDATACIPLGDEGYLRFMAVLVKQSFLQGVGPPEQRLGRMVWSRLRNLNGKKA